MTFSSSLSGCYINAHFTPAVYKYVLALPCQMSDLELDDASIFRYHFVCVCVYFRGRQSPHPTFSQALYAFSETPPSPSKAYAEYPGTALAATC